MVAPTVHWRANFANALASSGSRTPRELAALRLESGVPFHTLLAKRSGASRAEIVSALLVGLPAAGNAVVQCLPAALAAFVAD